LRYVVDVNQAAASELAGIYDAKPATIEAALGDPEVHAVGIYKDMLIHDFEAAPACSQETRVLLK
jgi:hypothetical protein